MPITLTYGPITAALNLAKQAGEGQAVVRREALAQQALDRIDRQAGQALDLRRQQIGEAMAYDRLRQQEREAQQQLAVRRAEFGAEQDYRQAQLASQAEKEARLREQWEFEQPLKEAAANRAERALRVQEQYLDLKQMSPQQQSLMRTPQMQALDERIKMVRQQLKEAEDELEAASDPIARKFGEWRPANEQAADRFFKAQAAIPRQRELLQQLRSQKAQALETAGPLPQYGRQAAGQMAAGQPALAQTPQERVTARLKQIAQGLATNLPEGLSDDQLYRAVMDTLVAMGGQQDDPDVDAAAREVVKLIKAMRG